jgi:hypothetical protein
VKILARLFQQYNPYAPFVATNSVATHQPNPARDFYRMLRILYDANFLYEALKDERITDIDPAAISALRTPANRVVEFYADHLWPGTLPDALPIETDNPTIVPFIEQVWDWSNWDSQKQVAARWFSLYGDLVIKVVQTPSKKRVYFQLIDPTFFTDFDTDERGFLTYVRTDIPIELRERDKIRGVMETEVWDKSTQTYRLWHHDESPDDPIEKIGTPLRTIPFSSFGIDFVPYVHVKFRDIGNKRGVGAFTHAIEKMIAADRDATRTDQMQFRHGEPIWAIEGDARLPSGGSIPPPTLPGATRDTSGGVTGAGVLTIGGTTFLAMPSQWHTKSLVPDVNFDAALAIAAAQLDENAQDLPELEYYRLKQLGDPSGVALRTFLAPAIARVMESRGNAESGLIRATQMALTIGANAKLFQLSGTFEDGSLDFRIANRPVIALDSEAVPPTAQTQAPVNMSGQPPMAQPNGAGVDAAAGAVPVQRGG